MSKKIQINVLTKRAYDSNLRAHDLNLRNFFGRIGTMIQLCADMFRHSAPTIRNGATKTLPQIVYITCGRVLPPAKNVEAYFDHLAWSARHSIDYSSLLVIHGSLKSND